MKSITFNSTKRPGVLLHSFFLTEAEYHDAENENNGLCVYCGEYSDGFCEPDARRYPCGSCNLKGVFGVPELLMMGFITITENENKNGEN